MFKELVEINQKPEPFEFYTAAELWTNEHTAKKMLQYHLNEEVDISSRNKKFIERSVDWITTHFGVDISTEIADFGCGPGLYANRLAKMGAKVTGIDFSGNSLKYARKMAAEKELNVNYVQTNYLNFETETRFDLIVMIMCDFCALSPDQRKAMISKFKTLLKPGGSVLLDVYTLKTFNQRNEAAIYELNQLNGFWSPDEYFGFVNTFKYEKEKVVLDKYTIIEESRNRLVYNWLQYFDRESLSAEFSENGLSIKEWYSNVAGTPYFEDCGEMAVVIKTV